MLSKALTAVITIWVAGAAAMSNYAPMESPIGISHGFLIHTCVTYGYPFCAQRVDQSFPQDAQTADVGDLIETKRWCHPEIYGLNFCCGLLATIGTGVVCESIGKIITSKKYLTVHLFWAVLIVGLIISAEAWQRDRSAAALSIGADSDLLTVSSIMWYPRWIQIGLLWGAVCTALLVLKFASMAFLAFIPAAFIQTLRSRRDSAIKKPARQGN